MKYSQPKYEFTYEPRVLDVTILFIILIYCWAGSFELFSLRFLSNWESKLICSLLLLYAIWNYLSIKSNKFIRIDQNGISIPDTYLPGIKQNQFLWRDIRYATYSSHNKLFTICLVLRGNKVHHIYTKMLVAYSNSKEVPDPVDKFMEYLDDVLSD